MALKNKMDRKSSSHRISTRIACMEGYGGRLPTPERMAKPDYEDDGPSRRKRVNLLVSLREAGKIDCAVEGAAASWLRDYELSMTGQADPVFMPANSDTLQERGDVHTWMMCRSFAGERIALVKASIGQAAHELLVMALVDNLSFRAIASSLYPNRAAGRASVEATGACVATLNILPAAYGQARKLQAERRKRDRELGEALREGQKAVA